MNDQNVKFSITRLIRVLLAVAVVVTACGAGLVRAADLTIFSAVSTTGAMTKIGSMFEAKTGKKIQFSFGATSTLARQIERGAPVDIFLSADHVWMNYLQDRKLIDTESRVDILGNSLVLITPLNSDLKIKIAKGFNLAEVLKGKRIAMGDPDHTAVGIYAKESLTNLGVWKQIEPMLARADSVRASLAMVERGEVGAGILFGTEAAVSKNVRLVDTFPAESHKAITYPVALLAKARTADARAFVNYLKAPEAEEVFRQFGFNLLK